MKKNLFEDCYHEGYVFKFKYIYNNEPIYVDNTTCDSIKYNEINSESYFIWEKQVDNNNLCEKVFNELERVIPDFKYDYRIDENGKLWFWEK